MLAKEFECEKCGFCCQLDVKLRSEDVKKIKKIKKNFTRRKDGETFLKKNGKFCVFYDNKLCSIYLYRPYECTRFPFNKDGSMNEKCRQKKDFSSKVTQSIVKFMNE
ncbi:YkgJ family cysteine cluster protein [Candidatus Woesearchaeota archaeon]|nr:YkgJ family cysteine cluster protein [Candidatus Woesearchaeota archaeon]